MTEHIGASWEKWRAEHDEPLEVEGTLAVWQDGSVTIDVGDGALRPIGELIADYYEARPDPKGDTFVGRVALRVGPVATLVPPGWVEPPASADDAADLAQRLRALERQRDGLQAVLAGMLDDPWLAGPDGRFCVLCGEIGGEIGEHADDCAVLRRDELLGRG